MNEAIAILLPWGESRRDWCLPGTRTHWLDAKFCGGLSAPHVLFADGTTRPMLRRTHEIHEPENGRIED